MVEVFPPQETVDGYTGAARAFLERACTFLLSTGAADAEQSLDFVRTVFPATEEEGGCNHSVIEATQAAILLKSHLLEFCEASDQEPMSSLRFGIGVECFAWSAPELELPISVRDGIRALCLANKRFGSQIVIGARAQRLAGDSIEVRPLELMEDPDTGLPLEVYELLGESGNLSDDELLERDAFWEGVVCLRSGNHDGAIERFERARSGEKVDPVLDYYLARSRGEELEDDLTHGDAADEEIDSIPVAYYRESDSEDRMETFIDVEDAVEIQIAPEKQ